MSYGENAQGRATLRMPQERNVTRKRERPAMKLTRLPESKRCPVDRNCHASPFQGSAATHDNVSVLQEGYASYYSDRGECHDEAWSMSGLT